MKSPQEHLNAAEMHRERVREFYTYAMALTIGLTIAFGVAVTWEKFTEYQIENTREE